MMATVFLIGYMGCGKTTLGEPLARVLGWRFVDLDTYIEQQCGMTAKEVFQHYGEAHFRELERSALREVDEQRGHHRVAAGERGAYHLAPGAARATRQAPTAQRHERRADNGIGEKRP